MGGHDVLNILWLVPVLAGGMALSAGAVIYNGLVKLRNDCDRAWCNIDVLLKQRYDEIPNLVEVCRGYMQHERETLGRVTDARARGLEAASATEADRAHGEACAALKGLYAVAEEYPDLKANEQFLRLQQRITGLEGEIADRREFFNSCVTIYNTRIEQLPDTVVARLAGWRRRPLLHMPEARGPVRVGRAA